MAGEPRLVSAAEGGGKIEHPKPTADACIVLWMAGGMAAPENFDPKKYVPFEVGLPVEKVMSTYGDKVRLVYRDYPLPFHPNARPASEAAACANAQGKFWEYHAKLFHGDGLEPEKLKTYADQVGLDRKKFDDCLEKKPFKAEIDKDVKDGEKAGVNGTPAFFINGRMLSGAQPFEKFKEVIDDELATATKS